MVCCTQATLHSDAIERFEKIYPKLVKTGQIDSSAETKQWYLKYLNIIQDLKMVHLRFHTLTMEAFFVYPYESLNPFDPAYKKQSKYIELYHSGTITIPEELIKEIIHDPRIGLGYCTQCHTEYPIKTGCTQTKRIYGKCHPKNFLPYLDKERKKVFKGGRHYKHCIEWEPDEYIPYSSEIMEKNRQFMRKQRTFQEKRAKEYEARNEPEKAKHARKNKIKVF